MEEIVEAGSIPPEDVHLPAIYVQRVHKGLQYEKRIERKTLRREPTSGEQSKAQEMRNKIIKRAALEFKDGMFGKSTCSTCCKIVQVYLCVACVFGQPTSVLGCQCLQATTSQKESRFIFKVRTVSLVWYEQICHSFPILHSTFTYVKLFK